MSPVRGPFTRMGEDMSTQEHVDVPAQTAADDILGDLATDFEQVETSAVPTRRWGWRALIAVGAVLTLVAVAVGVWTMVERNRRTSAEENYWAEIANFEAQEATAAAQLEADYNDLVAQLREALVLAQQVVDSSVGEVSNENGRITLVDAIASATQLVPEGAQMTFREQGFVVTAARPLHDDPNFPARRFVVAVDTVPALSDLEAALSWLQVSTEAVDSDHLEWATTRLQGAIETGEELIADVEDLISDIDDDLDDSDRDLLTALQDAIEAARQAQRDHADDAELLAGHVAAVTAATDELFDSQQGLVAQQQEAAIEAEEAARAQAEEEARLRAEAEARAQAEAEAREQEQENNNPEPTPEPSGISPADVSRILSPYANPVGPCVEAGRFYGDANTNWAAQGVSWSARVENVAFTAIGDGVGVTVIVSSCPAG